MTAPPRHNVQMKGLRKRRSESDKDFIIRGLTEQNRYLKLKLVEQEKDELALGKKNEWEIFERSARNPHHKKAN